MKLKFRTKKHFLIHKNDENIFYDFIKNNRNNKDDFRNSLKRGDEFYIIRRCVFYTSLIEAMRRVDIRLQKIRVKY